MQQNKTTIRVSVGCLLLAGLILVSLVVLAEQRTINLDLKSTPDGQLFYVEIEVGPTKQPFNLLVSTLYYITWLPSLEVSPTRGYVNQTVGFQNYTGENDFMIKLTGTGYGPFVYSIYNDSFQIGSQIVLEEQSFAVVKQFGPSLHFSSESKLDGILGLSGRKRRLEDPDYLFRNLYNLDLIGQLKFSLYINNTVDKDDADSSKGTLVLGGVDERYFEGEIRYVRWQENTFHTTLMSVNRSLAISSLQLDWKQTDYEQEESLSHIKRLASSDARVDILLWQEGALKLDSSAKLFVGHRKSLDQIHLDIIGATNIGSRQLGRSGLYVFNDCRLDNKPDFVFTLADGLELVVTPEDYVIEDVRDGRNICISAFMGYDMNTWVFGTKFLRKYYTVFDYANDRIGFAKPK